MYTLPCLSAQNIEVLKANIQILWTQDRTRRCGQMDMDHFSESRMKACTALAEEKGSQSGHPEVGVVLRVQFYDLPSWTTQAV